MSLEDEAEQLFLPKTETNLKQAVGTAGTVGTTLTDTGYSVPVDEYADGYSGYKTEFPNDEERPCYCVYIKPVKTGKKILKTGVYYHYQKITKNDPINIDIWICAPLFVEAVTHDKYSNNFGRYLTFKPTRGAMRQWSMVNGQCLWLC